MPWATNVKTYALTTLIGNETEAGRIEGTSKNQLKWLLKKCKCTLGVFLANLTPKKNGTF